MDNIQTPGTPFECIPSALSAIFLMIVFLNVYVQQPWNELVLMHDVLSSSDSTFKAHNHPNWPIMVLHSEQRMWVHKGCLENYAKSAREIWSILLFDLHITIVE